MSYKPPKPPAGSLWNQPPDPPKKKPFLNLPAAIAARDEAIEQVTGGIEEWVDGAVAIILRVAAARGRFTIDDVRALADKEGFPGPQEPRAWGGAMNAAAKSGRIRATGEYHRTAQAGSHAGARSVWEWIPPSERGRE